MSGSSALYVSNGTMNHVDRMMNQFVIIAFHRVL